MGYNLTNQQGNEYRFVQALWSKVLLLAKKYGWQAAGTSRPIDYDESEWDGNYWYNSGQVVETEDAVKLAEALEKALSHLPDQDVAIPEAQYALDPVSKLPKITNHDQIPIEDFFSGEKGKQAITSFIEFCREGSFEIR